MTKSPRHDSRARARRFAVALPVRYRPSGGRGWCDGVSINVSGTGISIATWGCAVPRRTRLDFQFFLPGVRGVPGARVRGTGRVIRVVAARRGQPGIMAVAIDHYAIGRSRGLDAVPLPRVPVPRRKAADR